MHGLATCFIPSNFPSEWANPSTLTPLENNTCYYVPSDLLWNGKTDHEPKVTFAN